MGIISIEWKGKTKEPRIWAFPPLGTERGSWAKWESADRQLEIEEEDPEQQEIIEGTS